MKLDEYIKDNSIEESVAKVLKVEFRSMMIVDIERYAPHIIKKMKERAVELTVNKVVDDFFFEAVEREGEIINIKVYYGLVPDYIDRVRLGKKFMLRKTKDGVTGCYYRL